MKLHRETVWLWSIVALMASASSIARAEAPKTVIWDGAHLEEMRQKRDAKDPQYKEVLKRLKKNAEICLQRGPYSVMDKYEVAPSGDKHDYLSFARYWWPNPDTPDGLPYIRRDGKTNKEILMRGDRETIGAMYEDVETLALAGYLFDDKRYSDHAALEIRTWFLLSDTRMSPHLKFAQAIPGRNDGRGSGIIDTRYFIRVLDAVRLLQESDSWTDEDSQQLAAWMSDYLEWLRSDPAGKHEAAGGNNHGTWYDAQVTGIAIFVGEHALAKQVLEQAKEGRIARCIEPDGQQPAEMARTKSLHYCVFNLSAMSVLARMGESLGVDLWNYESPDGRSIRRGLDFVTPALLGEDEWDHKQIDKFEFSPSDMGLFYMAASRYGEPRYRAALKEDTRKPMKYEYTRLQFPSHESDAPQ